MTFKKLYLTLIGIFVMNLAMSQVVFNFFNGTQVLYEIELSWQTSQELNMDYFTVERSDDGSNYIGIQTVAANGTSSTEIDYSYTDSDSLTDTCYYYRLRANELSGSFQYSDTLTICYVDPTASFDNALTSPYRIYPNPVRDGVLTIEVNFGTFEIALFNQAGQLILFQEYASGTTKVDLSAFGSGLYYVRVGNADSKQHVHKIAVD
jgi:hypothetical protein